MRNEGIRRNEGKRRDTVTGSRDIAIGSSVAHVYRYSIYDRISIHDRYVDIAYIAYIINIKIKLYMYDSFSVEIFNINKAPPPRGRDRFLSDKNLDIVFIKVFIIYFLLLLLRKVRSNFCCHC